MNATNDGLIPLTSMPIASHSGVGYDGEYAQRLFSSFRDVFCAERLPERAIFWVEEKFGRLIVRHVQDLKKRQRKGDDRLVTSTIKDLAAVQIMIGNFAAGCKLSTVRWEIYSDFYLSNLLGMGRFDYRDLAGDFDQGHAQNLITQGIRPIGDWDFDSIILMHRCPACRNVFDTHSILYLPNKHCDSCGKVPAWGYSQHIVEKMIRGYMQRLDKIRTQHTELPEGEFAVQYFIDPIPNSVMYWLLSIRHERMRLEPEHIFGSAENADYEKWLSAMYHRSLFSFMVSDFTRKMFTTYMEDRFGDCEILLKQWQRIGESMRTPLQATSSNSRKEGFLASDDDVLFVLKTFPVLVNMIITRHVKPQVPEKKALNHD